MSDGNFEFSKEKIEMLLKELAGNYRKQVGRNMPAEIILIGGASVLLNYGFRESTTDIDALFQYPSVMKDIINAVGDQNNLPDNWLNQDFVKTASFSKELVQYSKYYKTYSNILTIRTIAAEYLIAMKLRSGRQYKNDFSDILGVLSEHEKAGNPITLEQIKKAVNELYKDWNVLPEPSRNFILKVMQNGQFESLYKDIRKEEQKTRKLLVHFEQNYPDVLKSENVNETIYSIRAKAKRESILEMLRQESKEN